jgi:hypothetical protein
MAPLMAASLVVSTAAALALLRHVGSGTQAGARQWLFGWCALVCIKAIADGGPLTFRVAPCGATLLVLLAPVFGASWRTQRMLAAGGALVVALGLALWQGASDGAGGEALADLATTLALTGALGLQAAGFRSRLARAAQALCASCVAVALIGAVVRGPLELAAPLPSGATAFRCDLSSGLCQDEPVGGQTAFEVYRAAGDDALKPRRTMIAMSAARQTVVLPVVVHALSSTAPGPRDPPLPYPVAGPRADGPPGAVLADSRHGPARQALNALPMRPVGEPGNVLVLLRSDALPPIFGNAPTAWSQRNYHVFLHLGAAALRAQGLDRFVVVPLLRPSDAAGFGLVGPAAAG